MIRVGLTGTVGAGKSSVGGLFRKWGAVVLEADEIAREVVLPGAPALEEIRRVWGADVLRADGSLDRAVLRSLVFARPEARERLESILHPAIERVRRSRVRRAEKSGAEVVVSEVPLLLEKGLADRFDVLVVVDAPLDLRHRRVCARRGVTDSEFEGMEAAQWTGDRKTRHADHVIFNDASLEALSRVARLVWNEIQADVAASSTPRKTPK